MRRFGSEEQVEQPGLSALRLAVINYARREFPKPRSLRQDATAGLNTALANVPDGMANALLVGVNPLFGLYATIMGPLVGGLISSSRLMVITTTAAASLTAGQSLVNVPAETRAASLFVMVILAGVFQVLLGPLNLGRLTHFVSYSVTTGFLAGISILLVLNQFPTVTGFGVEGDNSIAKTFDLFVHLGEVDLWSLGLAGLTLGLAVVLPRTPVGELGRLVAIVVPSLLAVMMGLDGVQVVGDAGDVSSGIPQPQLPLFALVLDVLTGALPIGAVIQVQGAGVSQSVPNPDGSRSNTSRDFIAQGAANIASGFFRGSPVGGSLSATALNVLSGASSRWASVFAGLWMALIVIALLGPVGYIVMPALGALLVLAGIASLKPGEIRAVANAGWPSKLACATTFVSTLLLAIQAAVGIGVVLSALLYVTRSSTDIRVVQLIKRPDQRIEERKPVKSLPDDEVTVLDVYGRLFYAGAHTFERMLPEIRPDSFQPVVVLRLRGRTELEATLVDVLARYAKNLQNTGGRLYLTGLNKRAIEQVENSSKLRLGGPVRAYEVDPIVGLSTHQAYVDAQAWLVSEEEAA